MIDAILYIADFPALVDHLDANHPRMLLRDTQGDLIQPPVVTGFARTPAAVNGNSLMVYARLRLHEAEQWRDMPGVQVLAEVPFTGRGTAQTVYDQVFNDPATAATYESVYSTEPYQVTDEESGETTTITPPKWFGMMAGA